MPNPRDLARSAALGALAALLAVSAWVCLLAGLAVMLAGRLGTGPGLLVLGGGLILLVVLIFAIGAARQRPAPAAPQAAVLARALLVMLERPAQMRLAMGGLALVLGLAALFWPGGRGGGGGGDKPS